jgi:rare lipoprotein A
MKRKGSAQVRVQYIGKAPLEGNDMPYLMASYVKKGDRSPNAFPEGQIATGVMVASNEPLRKQAGNLGTLTIPAKSNMETGVPVTALAETAKPSAASAALETFAMLPEIGPLPKERPEYIPRPDGNMAYAAAYVEARVSDSKTAFDAILVDQNPLTPNSIVAYAKRQNAVR